MNRPTASQKEIESVLTYFNGQPDMLTAIVKDRTNRRGHLGDVLIQSFDPEGKFATFEARPPPAWSTPVTFEVPFEPPLKSIWDLRPRIKAWRNAAYKKYQVPAQPPITYFSAPTFFPLVAPALFGLAVLGFALYGWGEYADWLRAQIERYLGDIALPAAKWIALSLHLVVEPAYILYATSVHKTPLPVRLRWLACTMLVGFATIEEFWECIQYERIRHIYARTDVGDIGHRLAGPYEPPADKAEAKAAKKTQ